MSVEKLKENFNQKSAIEGPFDREREPLRDAAVDVYTRLYNKILPLLDEDMRVADGTNGGLYSLEGTYKHMTELYEAYEELENRGVDDLGDALSELSAYVGDIETMLKEEEKFLNSPSEYDNNPVQKLGENVAPGQGM